MRRSSDDDGAGTSDPSSVGGTFPGWRVVAGCFTVLLVTSGLAFYGLAVYLNAFSNEQGWALSSISFAVTIFFVIGGVTGLWVGRLIERFDVRWVLSIGAVIAGGSLAVIGQVTAQWQMYLAYVVFAVGYAFTGLVPTTTVVTRWFHVRRGVALSVASTGLSVGGIVITPFAKRFIDEYGLADTTPWLGLAFVVGIVPVVWLLVLPSPSKVGWEPDGVRLEIGATPAAATGTPYGEAVSSTYYRMITYGYVLALGSQVGGIQQLVKLVEDRTDERTAQFAITTLAATSVIARLIGGRVVSIIPMVGLTVVLAVLQAVSLVGLAVSSSTVLIFASIVLFGMTVGNLLMLQPLLIAERFGVLDYPRIYGRSQAIAIAGVAGGPLLIGWLYDVFGTYEWPYVITAGFCLVGAAVISRAGPASVGSVDRVATVPADV